MFDLTSLDYVYIGVILVSTIWATIRGGVYETVATLSWVVAAVVARFTSPMLDGLLQKLFKLSDSTVGTLVASYFIVFFVILLIVGFMNQKLRDKIQESVMRVTDHTLGVIFGIVRGVVVMGGVYWGILWYYSDTPMIAPWAAEARTRPLMQMTAIKIDEWFVPGKENKLLQRDIAGTREAEAIYHNLINPAVSDKGEKDTAPAKVVSAKEPTDKNKTGDTESEETGYKKSERTALENQLLQIGTVANAVERHEAAKEAAQASKSE